MITEIERNGKRWYECPIGLVPSVTTVIGVVDDLGWWQAKKAAEYAVHNIEELLERLGDKSLVQHIADASERYADEKGEVGTLVHEYITENLEGCIDPGIRPEPHKRIAGQIKHWWEFVDKYELFPVMSERAIYSEFGYAGRFDLIAWITWEGERRLYLVDLKSGKSVYGTVRLQLAAYRYGTIPVEDGEVPTFMPEVHACGVIHLRPKSCRFVPVDAGPAELTAFRHVREAFLAKQIYDERISPPCN